MGRKFRYQLRIFPCFLDTKKSQKLGTKFVRFIQKFWQNFQKISGRPEIPVRPHAPGTPRNECQHIANCRFIPQTWGNRITLPSKKTWNPGDTI